MSQVIPHTTMAGWPVRYFSAVWISWLYLPSVLPREKAPFFYLVIILVSALVSGWVIRLFCRYYYRDIPFDHVQLLSLSLLAASILAALIVFQSSDWPSLSILMVAILAFIHFRSVIRGLTDVLFVFWAVLSGLFIGLGFAIPVVILDVLICLCGWLWVNRRLKKTGYQFIIRYDSRIQERLMNLLQPLNYREISRSEEDGLINLTLSVKASDASLDMVDRIASLSGVQKALLITSETTGEGQK